MPIILQDEVLEFEWSSVRIEWGPKKETVGGHYFYPAEMSENKSEEQDSCLPSDAENESIFFTVYWSFRILATFAATDSFVKNKKVVHLLLNVNLLNQTKSHDWNVRCVIKYKLLILL